MGKYTKITLDLEKKIVCPFLLKNLANGKAERPEPGVFPFLYSPQSCKSRSLHSLLPATFILVFLDTVLCTLSMALQPWLWHWQCQAAAILFPELFSSVPPYSWHAQSGGSKSCRIAAGFISGELCTGLKSGWRSRAFP